MPSANLKKPLASITLVGELSGVRVVVELPHEIR